MNRMIFKGNVPNMKIGHKVTLGKNIIIGPNCRTMEIGFGSFIGDDVYIDVPNLRIGEYCTIHKNTTLHGYKDMTIGHNCWIGQNCVIDSIAGTIIGNNVGIGTYSQLWTHMKFGDCLEGCRWKSDKPLVIEDDCWFVGHCIVSPIVAHKKSMLLVGGVITKDMQENHVYGGTPAIDLTEKLGMQFDKKDVKHKRRDFIQLYHDFLEKNQIANNDFEIIIKDTIDEKEKIEEGKTIFFLKERIYKPTYSEIEYRFMKFLLYDKAKFIPIHKNL